MTVKVKGNLSAGRLIKSVDLIAFKAIIVTRTTY